MEQSKAIAKRIEEVCEQKGMNYKTLADACGEPARRIYRVMSGLLSCQAIILLVKICKALDVSLDEFFNSEELKEAFKEEK